MNHSLRSRERATSTRTFRAGSSVREATKAGAGPPRCSGIFQPFGSARAIELRRASRKTDKRKHSAGLVCLPDYLPDVEARVTWRTNHGDAADIVICLGSRVPTYKLGY